MSVVAPKYHITSGLYSAERHSIKKLDQVIEILQTIVTKLDNDNGISDTDYATISETLKSMRSEIANFE